MAGKRKTSRRKSAKISKKTFKFNPKKDKKLIIMLLVGFLLFGGVACAMAKDTIVLRKPEINAQCAGCCSPAKCAKKEDDCLSKCKKSENRKECKQNCYDKYETCIGHPCGWQGGGAIYTCIPEKGSCVIGKKEKCQQDGAYNSKQYVCEANPQGKGGCWVLVTYKGWDCLGQGNRGVRSGGGQSETCDPTTQGNKCIRENYLCGNDGVVRHSTDCQVNNKCLNLPRCSEVGSKCTDREMVGCDGSCEGDRTKCVKGDNFNIAKCCRPE